MIEKFIEAYPEAISTVILTPNTRLSRYLLSFIEVKKQKQCQTSWPTPTVLPINQWMEQVRIECELRGLLPAKICLSTSQKRAIWEAIISQDNSLSRLVDKNQLVKTAIRAWDTCQLWNLDNETLSNESQSVDEQQFVTWKHSVEQWYEKDGFMDPSQYGNILSTLFREESSEALDTILPKRLALFAFDELSPSHATLFGHMTRHGIEITHCAHQFIAAKPQQLAFDDIEHQFRAMANWAKMTTEQYPDAKIACIVPDLSSYREKIIRYLNEIFEPHAMGLQKTESIPQVNVSGGMSLADSPMISAGLDWCQFFIDKLSLKEFGALCRTTFFVTGATYLSRHAQMEKVTRQFGLTEMSAKAFVSWQTRKESDENSNHAFWSPELGSALADVCASYDQQAPYQSYQDWMAWFEQSLQAIGWPGEIEISSHQYQRLQQWQQVLTETSKNSVIQGKVSAKQALNVLRQNCQEHLFQVETQDTAVQVLGLLEAAGIDFDYVWIANVNDKQFPNPAEPNPLISYAIQKSRQTPHATPDREMDFAKRILRRYQDSTRYQLIASFASQSEDEEHNASPLISSYEKVESYVEELPESFVKQQFSRKQQELFEDDIGPAVTNNEKLTGGSQILTHYSACHFRGFTTARLQAESIPEFSRLFSAISRGLCCHSAMEWFWQDVKTSDTLQAMTREQRQKKLTSAIDFAINRHYPNNLPQSFAHCMTVEKRCLMHILENWLDRESERESFEVIHTEIKQLIHIANCEIQTRIDRVDRHPDGTVSIVDYKTGQSNIDAWFDARPDEPQLPLYAVSSEYPVSGLLFAKLRADEQAFYGISENDSTSENVIAVDDLANFDSWEALLQHWREHLHALTETVASGTAEINPKYGEQTCQYCDCASFCRIKQRMPA